MVAPPKPVKKVAGPPGIAAVVNGEKIKTSEVNALVTPRVADYRQNLDDQATELLINNMLVEQQAKKAGVTVTPAEVNSKFAQVKQQFAANPQSKGETLDSVIAKNHESMTDFKNSIRLRLLADKLVAKTLKPVKLVHVEYLLVATSNPNNNPTVKVHTDAEALKIIGKAQAGLKSGKKFEDVVKEYSDDPSTKDKGGDLGIIGGPNSGLDENFVNAALALKKGEVTPTPVKAPQFGYFLIKAVSTSADPLATDAAEYKAQLDAAQQSQSQEALQGYLQNLRSKAKVTSYLIP